MNELPFEEPIILMIDDDPDAPVLMRHLLREAHVPNPVHAVATAEEAVALLSTTITRGRPTDLPLLVFIDLKMPRVDGFEVLSWMQRRPELGRVPRIVLSSSLHETDVTHARALGATAFLTKYPSTTTIEVIVRLAKEQWSEPDLASFDRS